MKKFIIWLVVGIILFGLGGYQNIKYENLFVDVDATVTNINTVDDSDDGPTGYKHIYYGEYTLDGKKYTDVELTTKYTSSISPDHPEGSTISIRVNPDDPSGDASDGGLLIVAGFIVIGWSIVILVKAKKNKDAVS